MNNQDLTVRAANDLHIYLGEHAGVVGATGTGKTMFVTKGVMPYMREMYTHVPQYLLDSTGDPDMSRHLPHALFVEGNEPPDLIRDVTRPLVWTPKNSKIPKAYNRWFEKLNDSRKPAIIVIDEIASITREALEGLEGLFKQMRKHGGTVIAETQEIARVDTTIFRQLSHFFQFRISPEPYDERMARQYLGKAKGEYKQPTNKYGFHYRKIRSEWPAEEYHDLHDFFGKHMYPRERRDNWVE